MRSSSRLALSTLCSAIALLAAVAPAGAAPPCVPDDTTLCLGGASGSNRFQLRLDYQTVQGGGLAGAGHALPLAPIGVTDGGLFWFFGAANPEMVVKVLDGCGLNNRYWVFLSAATNVGYTLTVTDTLYDYVKTYINVDGSVAASVNDTNAFTCDGSDPGGGGGGGGDDPWILTTRPGTFFVPDAQNPTTQIDIPVASTEEFYKIVVEVEVDLAGWNANADGKHNIFRIFRGSGADLTQNLYGELGLRGPDANTIELVSNVGLPAGQWEVEERGLVLDENGTYSFLFVYDTGSGETKVYVYEGSTVGENKILLMKGTATGGFPITGSGSGFGISFGNPPGGGDDVTDYGWTYKNLKVYLEYPL